MARTSRAALARRRRLARKRRRNPPPGPVLKGKPRTRTAAQKKASAANLKKARSKNVKKDKKKSAPKKSAPKKTKTGRSKKSYQEAAAKGAKTRASNLRKKQRAALAKKTGKTGKKRLKRKKLTAAQKKRNRQLAVRRRSYGLKTVKRGGRRIVKIRKSKRGQAAWQTQRYIKAKGMTRIKNPANLMAGMKDAVMKVLPLAGSYYVSKLAVNKLGDLPMVSNLTSKLNVGGYALHKPVMSGVMLAVSHYGTRKGKLAKLRTPIMLGTALAFVDTVLSTFAPADVKAFMGVGEYVSMNDYVSVNEYVSSGEYVSMGADVTPGHGEPRYDYDDPHVHGLYAIDGIDRELGAIEAGVDTGNANGIFANGW